MFNSIADRFRNLTTSQTDQHRNQLNNEQKEYDQKEGERKDGENGEGGGSNGNSSNGNNNSNGNSNSSNTNGNNNPPNGINTNSIIGPLVPNIEYSVSTMLKLANFSRLTERTTTSSFPCGGYNWRVIVFPRGIPRRPGYLSCFIECEDLNNSNNSDLNIHVECLFTIIAKDSSKNFQRFFTTVLHSKCSDQGWDNVCPLSQIKDFLDSDALTFAIKIDIPDPTKRNFSRYRPDYDSKKETGMVGLVNQGATCYMNALLQNLYHLPLLRKAVYQMPIALSTQANSIAWQLQRLFYELQISNRAPETKNLTKSFGWSDMDAYRQHDIQEFARILQDKLEERMKNTPVDGTIKRLFVGDMQTYIECVNINYESKRTEHFYDLSVNVKGMPNLIKSFENYIEVENLDGSNQYRAEQHGLQDARKGSRFLKFPDVLQLQLKRFEYDPYEDKMVKINDRFEFSSDLDLTEFLANVPDADHNKKLEYSLFSVLVHAGGVHGGHYYGFIRPSATDNQWYKFDDETVVKVEEKEAIQDNFGGLISQNSFFSSSKIQKNNSAYMLTYIRKECAEEILSLESIDEVPASVVDAFKEDERIRLEEDEARKKAFMSSTIEIVFEKDIMLGAPNNIEVINKHVTARKYVVEKSKTLNDLRELIQKDSGIPIDRQAFFRFVKRENATTRPSNPVLPEEMSLCFGPIDSSIISPTLPATTPCWNKHEFYMAEFDPETIANDFEKLITGTPPSTGKAPSALILFKYFDIAKQELRLVGSRVVHRHDNVGSVVPHMIELTNKYYGRKLLNDDVKIRVWEETRAPVKIPEYSMTDNIFANGVITGDIFLFCPALSEKELEVAKDYWQTNIYKETPDIEINIDSEEFIYPAPNIFLSTPEQLLKAVCNKVKVKIEKRETTPVSFFHVEAYRDRPANELVKSVAACLKCPNENVRLFAMNNGKQYLLDSFITYSNNESLHQHIQYFPMFVSEVLEHPVDLLKTHVQANISFYDDKLVGTVFRPMCPKNGTMQDVVNVAKTMAQAAGIEIPDGPIRCLEIEKQKVSRLIPLETLGSNVFNWAKGYSSPNVNIRMEIIPAEERELKDGDKVVWCYNFSSNNGMPGYGSDFGAPFSMIVHEKETCIELKARIATRLAESAENAKRNWKLCTSSYFKNDVLADDAIVLENNLSNSRMHSNMTATLLQLGVQRPDSSSRPKQTNVGISISDS